MIGRLGYEFWKQDRISDPIAYNSVKGADDFYSNSAFVKAYIKNEVVKIVENNLYALEQNGIELNNRSVLDAGFGTGHFLKTVLQRYPSARVEGTEVSGVAIKAAKQLLPHVNLNFLNIENDHLKRIFDIVCCSHVLEHLQFPEKALENLMAMVNRGGILFIAVPDGRLDHFGGHIHYWGVASLPLMLQKTFPQYKVVTGSTLDGLNLYAIIYKEKV